MPGHEQGRERRCQPSDHVELWHAGMGLDGITSTLLLTINSSRPTPARVLQEAVKARAHVEVVLREHYPCTICERLAHRE